MLEKTVAIGDKQVRFRSSASVPRLYRIKFKRDIFKDLARLEKSFRENGGEDGSMMEIDDLEIFENVAYIMAFHADPTIPSTIDEWLEQFEMFSIYQVLFLLRCVEIGISISDLDLLTIGMVLDIWTEKGNDSVTYDRIAGQREFDAF